jgi:hypothetical protein
MRQQHGRLCILGPIKQKGRRHLVSELNALEPIPACHIRQQQAAREEEMSIRFKIGDHVTWNSEAGRVGGTIIALHTGDFDYKGHRHHASEDDPQYEIMSDTTDHVAAHKDSALSKTSRR